jgi:TolA-binding protein
MGELNRMTQFKDKTGGELSESLQANLGAGNGGGGSLGLANDNEVELLSEGSPSGGGAGGGASDGSTLNDQEVEMLSESAGGSLGAGASGGGASTGSGGSLGSQSSSQSSDAATIAQLQAQIAALQNRLNSLQGQSTTVYQNDPNLLAQITQLQNQINSLQQALSRLQGQSVTTYSQGLSYSQLLASQGGKTAGVETGGTYTVKKGDNLWNISKKYYGDGRLWRNILEANPNCLSRPGNVRTLRIGYVLTIPTLNNSTNVQTYSYNPGPSTQQASPVSQNSTIQTFSLNNQNSSAQTTSNFSVAKSGDAEVELTSEIDPNTGKSTAQGGGLNVLGSSTGFNSNQGSASNVTSTQKPNAVASVSDVSDNE